MPGYRPAQLYWYDSFTYLDTAVHLKPSARAPTGAGPPPEQPLIDKVREEYDPDTRGLYSVRPYADLLVACLAAALALRALLPQSLRTRQRAGGRGPGPLGRVVVRRSR